jgi:hypothetical protein
MFLGNAQKTWLANFLSLKPIFENNQIFQHGSTWAMIKIIWATTQKKCHCINGGNQTIVDPMIKIFLEKIEKQI